MVEILRFGVVGLFGCVGGIAVSIHPTFAQLTPDNTLGIERSVIIPINKDNDRIGGGAARGINLFHSFQDFNVGEGRGVYFANPEGITNIFSRVTGGNSSNIFGKLGVLGNANLFLLNPNGIVFGKNASLDLQGSFLGTTANSLVFPNGVEFSATNPQAPPLLSINVPIGLQFGSQPGSITNQAVNELSVGSGSTLALMGGEIGLDGSSLSTENGQVKLGAVSTDTTVGLNVNGSSLGFNFPENFGRAPINLTNANIFATGENSAIELFGGKIALNGSSLFGNNSGSIIVDATQFNLDNDSSVLSVTSGAAKGGDIQIQANDAVTLANGSTILSASNAEATGAGGDVTINGGKITITGDGTVKNSGKISASTNGKGNGGNLTLNARESVNVNGGFISVSSRGAGNGGNLTVRATDAVNITDRSSISSGTNAAGAGGDITINGGKITITGDGTVENSGKISTFSRAEGNGGNLTLNAKESVNVNGGFIDVSSGGAGNAGNLTVRATDAVNVTDRSSIYSNSNAAGAGGDITINAGKITITGDGTVENSGKFGIFSDGEGNGGNLTFNARESVNVNGGLILVSSGGAGNGGNLTVRATDAVNVTDRSSISSDSNAAGAGGDITINAGKITITGDGTVENSGKFGIYSYGEGNGGNLTFNARESINVNGGYISVNSGGAGNGGNLTVRATDAVNITNQGNLGLYSSSSGSTGNIQIETGTLRVQNNLSGSGVIALAYGTGSVGSISIQARNAVEVTQGDISTGVFLPLGGTTQATAGDITIETQRLNLKDGSDIRTTTFSNANAANIFIKASGYVDISGSSNISSDTASSGNGGNVTIETPQLSLTQGSYVSSNTGFGSGNGGNVTIETPRLSLTQGGYISTESIRSSGNAGNITIHAKDVELDGGLHDISDSYLDSYLSSDVTASNADVRGGTITIDTERLRLSNGGNISTSVQPGRGQGGDLVVHATDSIDITGVGGERLDGSFAPSGLFAELQTGGIGSGGSIDVTTGRLNLSNGGEISATTFNQGNAGNITINAEQINLHGSDSELFTGITSSVQKRGNGKGGDIDITTNNLDIRDAQIISSSIGKGEAGDIRINANFLEILGKSNSGIASSTNAGNGGNITLNIADLLLLRRGGFISSTAGKSEAGGDGGNININSKFIVAIPEENSDISANAYTGTGGKVQINSQGIFGIEPRPKPTDKSDITASSALGVSGVIKINAPDTNSIQNSFTEFSPNVIDTNALIANSCIVRSPKQDGTFFITGSGALRNSPNDASISIYSTGEVRNVSDNTSRTWKKGELIIEPTGAYRLADGRLVLSRKCQ